MLPALGRKKSKGKIILVLQDSKGLFHLEEVIIFFLSTKSSS